MNKFLNGIKYFFSTMFDDVVGKFFTGFLIIGGFISTMAVIALLSSIFGEYFLLVILSVVLIPYLVGHVITLVHTMIQERKYKKYQDACRKWDQSIKEFAKENKSNEDYYF